VYLRVVRAANLREIAAGSTAGVYLRSSQHGSYVVGAALLEQRDVHVHLLVRGRRARDLRLLKEFTAEIT